MLRVTLVPAPGAPLAERSHRTWIGRQTMNRRNFIGTAALGSVAGAAAAQPGAEPERGALRQWQARVPSLPGADGGEAAARIPDLSGHGQPGPVPSLAAIAARDGTAGDARADGGRREFHQRFLHHLHLRPVAGLALHGEAPVRDGESRRRTGGDGVDSQSQRRDLPGVPEGHRVPHEARRQEPRGRPEVHGRFRRTRHQLERPHAPDRTGRGLPGLSAAVGNQDASLCAADPRAAAGPEDSPQPGIRRLDRAIRREALSARRPVQSLPLPMGGAESGRRAGAGRRQVAGLSSAQHLRSP